ncbi:hypothetical protein PPERSA_03026 [Pseudocohnilembus persalinus]|uniref:Uncharacterized protein n=1 Tax=Pseudocohnilembus persalinus TaxID=266149 RepID=A0A0V0QEY0_PSEPJ|nr:hypothetical protein PPERSA_03026 [Pseudocohnilembus persalinus]|eukprot:KRX00766.1 hypothetical protein PPERSA_03026 [Pseudocohnilembus persalinus]
MLIWNTQRRIKYLNSLQEIQVIQYYKPKLIHKFQINTLQSQSQSDLSEDQESPNRNINQAYRDMKASIGYQNQLTEFDSGQKKKQGQLTHQETIALENNSYFKILENNHLYLYQASQI